MFIHLFSILSALQTPLLIQQHQSSHNFMALESYLPEINTFSQLLLLLSVIIFIFKFLNSTSSKHRNLPPGPFQWPIIGNIPNVIGKKPHVLVTKIAEIHGPLITLKLGTQLIIIGSTRAAASEILRAHDRELSAMYAPKATPIKESDLKQFSLLWATECSNQWKSIRVLWKSELFSNKSLDGQARLREEKVAEMVKFLNTKEGKVINLGDVVFTAVFRTLGMVCFSKDLMNFEDEAAGSGLKDTVWRFMECSTTPIVGDFFPIFDGFDPQFVKMKAKKCLNKLFNVWRGEVVVRRKMYGNNSNGAQRYGDFLDFMLAHGFSDIQIDYMLLEIIPAGLGTLTTTVEWAMAELLKNRDVMERLNEELKGATDFRPIKESDIFESRYLNACIKETLRLHPPIAFLPHCAKETCEVMSYTIPKNSLVFVNLWALGHDPKTWDNPFEFKPERFLNSNVDFKGQDFEFIPFGAGRRMCPGMPFATRAAHLILASMVSCFEWSLPSGADASQLDMNEKYAVPLRKEQPLILVPTIKKNRND